MMIEQQHRQQRYYWDISRFFYYLSSKMDSEHNFQLISIHISIVQYWLIGNRILFFPFSKFIKKKTNVSIEPIHYSTAIITIWPFFTMMMIKWNFYWLSITHTHKWINKQEVCVCVCVLFIYEHHWRWWSIQKKENRIQLRFSFFFFIIDRV
mgnify:CR=1 FL=1